jgi:hypothetical protein
LITSAKHKISPAISRKNKNLELKSAADSLVSNDESRLLQKPIFLTTKERMTTRTQPTIGKSSTGRAKRAHNWPFQVIGQ